MIEIIVCGIILVGLLLALGARGINININKEPKPSRKLPKVPDAHIPDGEGIYEDEGAE